MNPQLAREITNQHMADLQREAQRCPAPGQADPAWPQLRSRIGFALVGAGLRLLDGGPVTARPRLD